MRPDLLVIADLHIIEGRKRLILRPALDRFHEFHSREQNLGGDTAFDPQPTWIAIRPEPLGEDDVKGRAEHLRRILANYSGYYNDVRVHSSLGKDAPCTRLIERSGVIVAYPIFGGLHHRYARI